MEELYEKIKEGIDALKKYGLKPSCITLSKEYTKEAKEKGITSIFGVPIDFSGTFGETFTIRSAPTFELFDDEDYD